MPKNDESPLTAENAKGRKVRITSEPLKNSLNTVGFPDIGIIDGYDANTKRCLIVFTRTDENGTLVNQTVAVTDNNFEMVVEAISEEITEALEKPKKAAKKKTKEVELITDPHEIIGQDDTKRLVRVAVEKNLPVLLIGDTGVGKTSIVKGIADKMKQEYIRYNLTGETTVDEFLGKYTLQNGQTEWQDGILLQAMKTGKWLIVDEINVALPEILFVLHSLLDDDKAVLVANHNGEVVKPHPDFRFFATMNPVDEYAGTKDLNKAFKSRFAMVINMQYPSAKTEVKIVQAKTGVDEKQANMMVDTANQIRKDKDKGDIFFTISTRDLLQWGSLVDELGSAKAFEVSILSKANGDSKHIAKVHQSITGQYIQLEREGIELRIDFFVDEYKKLLAAKHELETKQDEVRKKVLEEVMAQLGKKEK